LFPVSALHYRASFFVHFSSFLYQFLKVGRIFSYFTWLLATELYNVCSGILNHESLFCQIAQLPLFLKSSDGNGTPFLLDVEKSLLEC
jgi:hypothetical protein